MPDTYIRRVSGTITCEVCGNEIPSVSVTCPFCDHPVTPSKAPAKKKVKLVREVMIKEGQPTVDEALNRFKDSLKSARASGVKVIRVIHGYGSTGQGGAIKAAFLSYCQTLVTNSRIQRYMTGEEYFNEGAKHNPLIKKYPELMDTWSHDKGNPGVTIVEI